jgi:peptide/nickel transport system permease protein
MLSYVVRRLLLMSVTLIGISMVTFTIVAMAPGKRVGGSSTMDPGTLSSEKARIAREQEKLYHLDKPPPVRYGLWLWQMAQLNFGESWHVRKGEKVLDLMWARMGPTVQMNLISIAVVYLIAIPLGTMQALKRNTWLDYVTTIFTFALYSIPSYVVGTLILVFLCNDSFVNIFPLGLGGERAANLPPWEGIIDRLWRLTPGVICLTYGGFAYLSKLQRGALLETLRADYVRTAYAKGLSHGRVVIRHAMRNSLLPLITIAASILPGLLGGSVVVEQIFNINGLGLLGWEALRAYDEPIVLATATISAFLLLVSLLVVDLLYAKADPRIAYH